MSRAVMQQVLEALEDAWLDGSMGKGAVARHNSAITALREELAKPDHIPDAGKMVKPEPFGYWHEGATEEESDFFLHSASGHVGCSECVALYAAPTAAQRQPLTDEQEREAFEKYAIRTICNPVDLQRVRLNGYSSQELNYLWRGWKARAAHGIKEQP